MDQATAQQLFQDGAILVFLDAPPGLEFGIDYNAWTVGEKFKGVKMIPPGIHFVYYSMSSPHSQQGPRSGFFHCFKTREVLVKKWDKYNEDISHTEASEEEVQRFASNKQELDRFLGPYPYDSYRKWVSLTQHMSEELVTRLQPASGQICSVVQLQSESSNSQSRKLAAEQGMAHNDEEGMPQLNRVQGSEFHFTPIPKQKYPPGATPSEITKYSLDFSYVLTCVLDSAYKDQPMGILGEIQFSFVCFLLGQVYEAFEQWKHLVHLMCFSDQAVADRPELFGQFITIMHYHLKEIPEDFFVDIVSRNNFLTTTLQAFFRNVEENSAVGEGLKKRAQKFKVHLQKTFKWDFSEESDEDAPVVVDLGVGDVK